jgi:glycosyltransferase involved in cell wall biosynthesis
MGVPLGIYTIPACFGLNVKHIISERNDPEHFAGKKSIKIISRLLLRFAHGYIFQTKDARDSYGLRIAEKSKVIANPLFNLQDMPEYPFIGEREKMIVSVGRLNEQKNQKLLIDAFVEVHKIHPEYGLTIWGEGPERNKLEKIIRDYGLSESVFLPGTQKNLVNELYKKSVFVLCSDFEGMPNALMEAMALGLPCISTDCPCGGPRELIENGVNGLLISVGSKQQLIQAMLTVINCTIDVKSLCNKAFKIREKYSIDNICKEWMSALEEFAVIPRHLF